MGRVRGAGRELPGVLVLPSAPWLWHAGHRHGAARRHWKQLLTPFCSRFDEEAMPLTRSWCLFELLQTVLLQAGIGRAASTWSLPGEEELPRPHAT